LNRYPGKYWKKRQPKTHNSNEFMKRLRNLRKKINSTGGKEVFRERCKVGRWGKEGS
jgi:hypothetical protein